MTKIAITSASGHLGAAVVRATIEIVGKENVVGLARTPAKAKGLGVEIRPGDYGAPDDVNGSLEGTVIAGIYEGIRNGALDNESDFALAAGREHQDWRSYFGGLKSVP